MDFVNYKDYIRIKQNNKTRACTMHGMGSRGGSGMVANFTRRSSLQYVTLLSLSLSALWSNTIEGVTN